MSVEQILKDIRKKYGNDGVFTLDDFSGEKVDAISTGYLDLDIKSGIGGIPKGRVTEIFGPEGSGKSVLCQSITANAQKLDLLCAYIDTESSLDLSFSSKIGVDPNKIIISQPNDLDSALGIAEELVRCKDVKLLIFDSLVGVGTAQEAEDDFGKANYGGTKLNYQWFRRNMPFIRDNNVAVVFTNQVRDKMGAWIPTFDTPGGHAIKHYSSIRIQTSRVSSKDIKSGEDIIGITCTATFKKNKVAAPFKVANFEIYFDRGIWPESDILINALEYGIISQRGAYTVYEGETLAQGKTNTIKLLESRPDFAEQIHNQLLTLYGIVV